MAVVKFPCFCFAPHTRTPPLVPAGRGSAQAPRPFLSRLHGFYCRWLVCVVESGYTRGSEIQARLRSGRYWLCCGPVLGPASAGRNQRASIWVSVLRFEPGGAYPGFWGAFCRQVRQPARVKFAASAKAPDADFFLPGFRWV